METKFTKGEWINLGCRVDVEIADGLSGICEMSDWMGDKEMESNARLIASAPEILNNLIESTKALELCVYLFEKDMALTTKYVITQQIEQNKEAIKKATE